MNRQQFCRHPGVLAGDGVDGVEDAERPQGDVGGVTDRGGDHVETRIQARPGGAAIGRFTRLGGVARLWLRLGSATRERLTTDR